MSEPQNEEVEIRTGLQAGDDGGVIYGSGNAAPDGGTYGSGHAAPGTGTLGTGH